MAAILVIQTAFIGDVVLATSLLETLHHQLPQQPIDVLVRKGNESLFRHHPFVRKVWVWDKQHNKYGNALRLVLAFRREKYQAVINLQRYALSALMTLFAGAATTIGFKAHPLSRFFQRTVPHAIQADGSKHEIERNLQLLQAWDAQVNWQLQGPKLYPDATALAAASTWQVPAYCCIAPGSVWFTKTLPLEQWAQLIQSLPAHLTVYLLGGPGDKSMCETLKQESQRPHVVNLAGQLDFLGSAALQSKALMNYVNDSAPMHFCSAMNAPVTAVYCSTVPGFGYGPLSTEKQVVETKLPLACRPCGNHGKKACPAGHFKCATTIANSDLLAALPASANSV